MKNTFRAMKILSVKRNREIIKIIVVLAISILAITVLWYFRGKDIEKHRREFPQKISHGGDQFFKLPKCEVASMLKFKGTFSQDIFIGGCCPDECELP